MQLSSLSHTSITHKDKKKKMGIELQNHQSHHEEASPAEEPMSRWLINTPEPPSMWQELIGYIRTNVLAKKKHKRNKTKNSSSNLVYSCLKSAFPILSWGRQYKLNLFKKDLMAGLTLASLCIPQVTLSTNFIKKRKKTLLTNCNRYMSILPINVGFLVIDTFSISCCRV